MHVYFINCFNAKLYRETLPVALTVRFVMMWPICYSETFLTFRLCEIQQTVCLVVAYGRLKTLTYLGPSIIKRFILPIVTPKAFPLLNNYGP